MFWSTVAEELVDEVWLVPEAGVVLVVAAMLGDMLGFS
jgi:hypothetical protein